LLSVSSFLLCASVVTYISEADNYKQQTQKLKSQANSAIADKDKAEQQLKEKTQAFQKEEDRLNKKNASLDNEIRTLKVKIDEFDREITSLNHQVDSYEAITKDYFATTDKQTKLFENTFAELTKVKAEKGDLDKKLEEVTSKLIENMAFIDTLNTEKKRLLEKNAELQRMLDERLRPVGKDIDVPPAVTKQKGKVRGPLDTAVGKISLKGSVTDVDLENSLASISISAVDGVKEGMKFHISRSDEYICEILIINTDGEHAVGILELMDEKKPLKVGDSASTNF
jgi:chromosome segregation ATPase